MPCYITGDLIKGLRIRKKMACKSLLGSAEYDDLVVYRAETSRHRPRDERLTAFMEHLEVPGDMLVCPYLENQPIVAYEIRDRLLFALDNEDWETAKMCVKVLEEEFEFSEGVNLQFLWSCHARLANGRLENAVDVLAVADKALRITFPEFDEITYEGDILLFEEADLMLTMACVFDRLGETQRAIRLLCQAEKGLGLLPESDRDKEKKLPRVLLCLSGLLIKASDFTAGLTVCEKGAAISLKRNRGRELADFAYNKALCLWGLGDKETLPDILHQAYFGYVLLHKHKKAQWLREQAE